MSSKDCSENTTINSIDLGFSIVEDNVEKARHIVTKINSCFEGRLYMNVSETSTLLGMSTKTLKRHVDLDHIKFARIGVGKRKIRRVFSAHDIAEFCLWASGISQTFFQDGKNKRRWAYERKLARGGRKFD